MKSMEHSEKSNAGINKKILVLVLLSIGIIIAATIFFWGQFFGGYEGYVSIDEKNLFVLSLTEDNPALQITIPLPDDFEGDAEDLDIEIVRNGQKKYIEYDNLFQGGSLRKWRTKAGDSLFNGMKREIVSSEEGTLGKRQLNLTIDHNCYFSAKDAFTGKSTPDNSIPHTNDPEYYSMCGYFNVNASIKGDTVGSVTLKVVPYNSYRTMDEIKTEITGLAHEDSDYYIEEFSLGLSSGGRNIPFLIIADKKSTVNKWTSLVEKAKGNPDEVLKMIDKGQLNNVKVPILLSSIHGNEVSGADGIINFAKMIVNGESLDYDVLSDFTQVGWEEISAQRGEEGEEGAIATSELIMDKSSLLGTIMGENQVSGPVDLKKYYDVERNNLTADKLLEDVFFILIPTVNPDGRVNGSRYADNGYDLNRDAQFQTTPEVQSLTELIGRYNPVSFVEFHGRIEEFQCEPCTPPHQPNFEYDLLAEHLIGGGQALGNAAVTNNKKYNSYVIPQRDYLYYTGEKDETGEYETYWEYPWDDMSTGYIPQFAMLHGTLGYTVELPAYNEDTVNATTYGIIGHSDYVAGNKKNLLKNLFVFFKRGLDNENSNDYDMAGKWFSDQNDRPGEETSLFRPTYSGEGENGNFYPECYIIPLDRDNQKNLQGALDMLVWLARNDVDVYVTGDSFSYHEVTFPEGTAVVPMYQAKRSVANSALYKGTFISTWTMLYSESAAAFDKIRGFDMKTVTEPSAYKEIKGKFYTQLSNNQILELVSDYKSSFTGEKSKEVIIHNTSEATVEVVNFLLSKGKKVGLVTEGEYRGDFICSYEDYLTICKKFVFTATGIDGEGIMARIITKSPKVYITGNPASIFVDSKSKEVNYDNEKFNYDRVAIDEMGFEITSIPAAADVIVGSNPLNEGELPYVKGGTPYIGFGNDAVSGISFLEGLSFEYCSGALDYLANVNYPDDSLINASYIKENDNVMYGYGCGYFKTIPDGARVLAAMEKGSPLSGFVPLTDGDKMASYEEFTNGSIQAFEYAVGEESEEKLDVVLFANSLTHRGNQKDEYGYISNFIFSRMLGDSFGEKEG